MEPIKIIDVNTSFLCNYFFQHSGAGDNKSNEDDFFTGYADAENYLSLDFDCPLKRLAVIPTGVKERLLRKQDRKENHSNKISA